LTRVPSARDSRSPRSRALSRGRGCPRGRRSRAARAVRAVALAPHERLDLAHRQLARDDAPGEALDGLGLSSPSSARAWPIDSRPAHELAHARRQRSRRSAFATVLRSLPTRVASASCV
jgi:hypothetical protein